MDILNFTEWLSTLPGAPTPSVAAKKAGLNHTSLLRHAKKGQTTAENVIEIARSFGVDPVSALTKNGFLTPREVGVTGNLDIELALPSASWGQLFAEITRRVNASPMFEGEFELSLDTPVEIIPPADFEERKARALRLAKEGKAAAQKRTPRLEEPESP